MGDFPPPPFGQQPAPPPRSWLENRPAFVPLLIAAGLALIGAADMPYGYYEFLRVALTITGVVVLVHAVRSESWGWLALGIPIIFLWAPAVFVPLPAAAWKVLDLMVAAALIVGALLIPGPPDDRNSGSTRMSSLKVNVLVVLIGVGLSFIALSPSSNDVDCVLQRDGRSTWCE